MGREVARRGLYSRFFKGTSASSVSADEELKVGEVVFEVVAGPSRITEEGVIVGAKWKDQESVIEGETKEERRARRAERVMRKATRDVRNEVKIEADGADRMRKGKGKRGGIDMDGEARIKKKKRRKMERDNCEPLASTSPDDGLALQAVQSTGEGSMDDARMVMET